MSGYPDLVAIEAEIGHFAVLVEANAELAAAETQLAEAYATLRPLIEEVQSRRDRMRALRSKFNLDAVRASELSRQELAVAQYLTETHMSVREIADSMYLSVNTIKTHTKNLYAKLGVNSRHQVARTIEDLGLIGDVGDPK